MYILAILDLAFGGFLLLLLIASRIDMFPEEELSFSFQAECILIIVSVLLILSGASIV